MDITTQDSTMNGPRRSVLVLGANGRLGQAAVGAFAAAGWQVLASARRAPVRPLPAGARHLATPLHDTATLAAQAAGASVVVHALNPRYTRWAQEVLPLGRHGMDLAQRLGATFMLPGNVYNYGSALPALLQTDTPQHPDTVKGRIRAMLETEMQTRAARGLRSVVLRAGDFFGGGVRGAWMDKVVLASMAKHRLVYPGPMDVPHAWAYVHDLARAFVAVAARDDLEPFTRLHFAGHTLTGAQLLATVERAAASLGIVPAAGWRHASMPWGLLRLGSLVRPMWRELVEVEYLWRMPHALDGHALAAAVGALPDTPLDIAVRAALRDLGLGAAEVTDPVAAH
jgi:nucleoside-diphosphate-sugar epimerase